MNASTGCVAAYLGVPYVLTVETVVGSDGQWRCQLSHEELPGCSVSAPTALEALDRLEEKRVQCIERLLLAGESVPVPRPALAV